MAQDYLKGIYNKFSSVPASSFYNTIGGKLYLIEAPQNTDYPFATYNLTYTEHEHGFTSDYDEVSIEFNPVEIGSSSYFIRIEDNKGLIKLKRILE